MGRGFAVDGGRIGVWSGVVSGSYPQCIITLRIGQGKKPEEKLEDENICLRLKKKLRYNLNPMS